MKSEVPKRDEGPPVSLPARGAWIEIHPVPQVYGGDPSLPARGAWIEINIASGAPTSDVASLPARGAWIEIGLHFLP